MAEQTIPVPEKYKKQFEELIALDKQIYDIKRDHEIKASTLWTEIEKEIDARGKVLKFNQDKFTITIIDDSQKRENELLKKIRAGQATPYNHTPVVMSKDQMGRALPDIRLPKTPLWERIKNSLRS